MLFHTRCVFHRAENEVTESANEVDFRHQSTQSIDLKPVISKLKTDFIYDLPVIKTEKVPIQLEPSEFIFAPITIQQDGGRVLKLHGIVDTAAQLPVLTTAFCRANGIDLFPISRKNLTTNYFDGRLELLSWQTAPLSVCYFPTFEDRSVFLVLDSVSQHCCLIGGMLRHRMGLDDATNIATEFPCEIKPDLPVHTTIATVTNSIHRIERIISSPPRTTLPFTKLVFDIGSDDDFIVQDWTEIPKTSIPKDQYV